MDPAITDGSGPLANRRREAFCQAYAGDAWGNAAEAYRMAGYRPRGPNCDVSAGSRLLTYVDVSTRVRFLRAQWQAELHVDTRTILEARKAIASDQKTGAGDRLTAWRDIERALGLARPDRLDVTTGGQPLRTEVVIVPRGSAADAES
jgi:hypothetical protein